MNQRDDLGCRTPGDWLAVVRPGQDWGFPSCYGQQTQRCAVTPAAAPCSTRTRRPEASRRFHPFRRFPLVAFVAEWQTGVAEARRASKTNAGTAVTS